MAEVSLTKDMLPLPLLKGERIELGERKKNKGGGEKDGIEGEGGGVVQKG